MAITKILTCPNYDMKYHCCDCNKYAYSDSELTMVVDNPPCRYLPADSKDDDGKALFLLDNNGNPMCATIFEEDYR